MRVAVLIVAAGNATRMGGAIPKPYLNLGGKAVLRHSLEVFMKHRAVDSIRVVINETHKKLYDEATQGLNLADPVIGGKERQDSVYNGLMALKSESPDAVLIHDAARPGVSPALIDRVIDGLESSEAVIPVIAVTDTIKQVADNHVIATLERSSLRAVQTPQGFHYKMIVGAHENYQGVATDDAAMAEQYGAEIMTVEGEAANDKLTTPQDWQRMQCWSVRTGQGFDVHAFETSDKPLVICGVEVESELALKGHSDADVGLHALVDALLGAMAEGDIGTHFPPSDKQWKNADSAKFVAHAMQLLKEKGGEIEHVDITLIAEQPKIGPHRNAMRDRLAELLSVSQDRVSVKATTTEKLGFTGRGEGMAAQAVATIRLPQQGVGA